MSQSFSLKTIRITVTLGQGVFSEGGNTKIIDDFACKASVTKPGLPEQNSASVSIWGLKYDDMAAMTVLSFRPLESYRNTISIEAGEKDKDLSLVFKGNITRASADFNQSPDPVMNFEALSGYFSQQIARPASSIKGESPAPVLFEQWAKDAGMSFKNEGVAYSVKNAYFPGDSISKIKKLSSDIGCRAIIDDEELIVMPADQPRSGAAVLLNKETGLIGYPSFNQKGIALKCIFNPYARLYGRVQVESITPRATGTWVITKLSHSISAYENSGGNWETAIEASRPGMIYG